MSGDSQPTVTRRELQRILVRASVMIILFTSIFYALFQPYISYPISTNYLTLVLCLSVLIVMVSEGGVLLVTYGIALWKWRQEQVIEATKASVKQVAFSLFGDKK